MLGQADMSDRQRHPTPARTALTSMQGDNQIRGGDQLGLRAYNKRMILNLIRQAGALPKAEIARLTGLSAQAVSVIVNALLKEKLVRKEKKVRGKVGQPHTPIALNANGVLSVGVKIGRRSLELMLVNFHGEAIVYQQFPYAAPRQRAVAALLRQELANLLAGVDETLRDRIIGVGVAMPGQISAWTDVMGLDPAELMDWDQIDIVAFIAEQTGLPVEIHNDATAACAAEMVLGGALTFSNALYLYVGTFIGGGVVINGQLFEGAQHNAGALGSMPVATAGGGREQLIRQGSLFRLERTLREAGIREAGMIADLVQDPRAKDAFGQWRQSAAAPVAQAIAAALSVIDFEGVVIDAMLHPPEVEAFVQDVRDALLRIDMTGTSPMVLRHGSIGPKARVTGAALLPLIRQFSPDQELLVKKAVAAA
ncbi:ROK family transcriptional regulator [Pelagibius litoralis]|uniref:ROK family transcriptional regulator n=1 Tax=Pelagibius litoralis TaxID=374515 RepID=A0A967K7N4_9PROT|nr:ROK family transcriptional regulator [Pelagibius litoralis]NIA69943.1 ROK family transcriptional regulator [Pelagibius litoralis]